MAYLDDVTNILEIRPNGLPTVVRLSQNENGRKLYFRLTGNETAIPSGVTVTISGTKPDGVVYSATGSITNDVVLINENTQMTAVAGTWDAKIKIVSSGQTIATGRVRFEIDADTVAPGSVPSDSELEGLVAEAQAYAENARSAAYGSPLTASTVAGMTDQTRVYVYTGSETGYTAGNWYYWNGTAWTSGGVYNSTALQTDTTLAIPGMAADAKATGDAIDGLDARLDTAEDDITDVKSDLVDMQEEIDEFSGGLTPAIKEALLNCFAHVGWDHETDSTYYDALEEALYADEIKHITAVFTPGTHEVYTTDNIESLRNFLVVTATYNDDTQAVVTDYTLEGDISSTGTKTITVKYGRTKTTTFTVSVVTNSTGILYEWDFTKGLTDLRQGHTVKLYTGNKEFDPDGEYEGTTPPALTMSGVQFNDISQSIKVFDRDYSTNNLFGKTIQVDVASFNFKGNSNNDNIRFIVFCDPAERWSSAPLLGDGLIYRKASGWSFYDGYQWKDNIYTGMSSANAISGHKISAFLASNGAMKLYVDGSSKGTGQAQTLNNHTWQGLWIGDGSVGGFFRDALITGIRIYNGEVAN